jgi:hypothetical protein
MGSLFWRAQAGCDWSEENEDGISNPIPFGRERMKPRQDRAKEGRANPKGIPCLYMATDKETAMSEVRPWVGNHISAGQFVTNRDLRLVNCEYDGKFHFPMEGPPEIINKAVWSDIGRAFSQPVTRSDDESEYVPTQILAECFRHNSYDGLVYTSSLGKGFNIALFDILSADQTCCLLFETKSVEFEFQEAGNGWYAKRETPPTN